MQEKNPNRRKNIDFIRLLFFIPASAVGAFVIYALWLAFNNLFFINPDKPDTWTVFHKIIGHIIVVYFSFLVGVYVAPKNRRDFSYKVIALSVIAVSVISVIQSVFYEDSKLDVLLYTIINILTALYIYTNRNISILHTYAENVDGNIIEHNFPKMNNWKKLLIIIASFIVSVVILTLISYQFKLNPDAMSIPVCTTLLSMLVIRNIKTWRDIKNTFIPDLIRLFSVQETANRKEQNTVSSIIKHEISYNDVKNINEKTNLFLKISVVVLMAVVLSFIVYSFIK